MNFFEECNFGFLCKGFVFDGIIIGVLFYWHVGLLTSLQIRNVLLCYALFVISYATVLPFKTSSILPNGYSFATFHSPQ